MLVLVRNLSVPQIPFRQSRILVRHRDGDRRDVLDGSSPHQLRSIGGADRSRAPQSVPPVDRTDRLSPRGSSTPRSFLSIVVSRPCVREWFPSLSDHPCCCPLLSRT